MAEKNNIQIFINKIKNGELPNKVLLFGEEAFFIDKATDLIEQIARTKKWDLLKFSASDIKLPDLVDLARQGSLFFSERIIIVKDIGFYFRGVSKRNNENDESEDNKILLLSTDHQILFKYLKNPNSLTHLFFINHDKLDERSKVVKELLKYFDVYQSKRLYEDDILEFIANKLKEKDFKFDFSVIEYIYKVVGNNLVDIDSQIESLSISLEGNKKIDVELIKRYLITSKKYSIFDLYNAFRDKDLSRALVIGNNLIENNFELIYILTMLFRYFQSLLMFNELRRDYKTDEKISKIIGCHPFFLKDYEIASKRYKFEELENIFDILLNTEIELKTYNIDEKNLYTKLIGEIGLVIGKL